MPNNITLPSEQLKQALSKLQKIENKLMNDATPNKLQGALFKEIQDLRKSAQEKINAVNQLILAQTNELTSTQIKAKLDATKSIIQELENGIKGYENTCFSSEKSKQLLTRVNNAQNIFNVLKFLTTSQEHFDLTFEYNNQVRHLSEIHTIITNHSTNEVDNQDPATQLEAMKLEIQDLKQDIETYTANNSLSSYRANLITTSKSILKNIRSTISTVSEEIKPKFQEQLDLLIAMNQQYLIEKENEEQDSDAERQLLAIAEKIQALKDEMEAYQKKYILFENKENLLTITTDLHTQLLSFAETFGASTPALKPEYDTQVALLGDLKAYIEASVSILPEEFQGLYNKTLKKLIAVEQSIKAAIKVHQNDVSAILADLERIKTIELEELEILVGRYEGDVNALSEVRLTELEKIYKTALTKVTAFNTDEQELDQKMEKILTQFNGSYRNLLDHLKEQFDELIGEFDAFKIKFNTFQEKR